MEVPFDSDSAFPVFRVFPKSKYASIFWVSRILPKISVLRTSERTIRLNDPVNRRLPLVRLFTPAEASRFLPSYFSKRTSNSLAVIALERVFRLNRLRMNSAAQASSWSMTAVLAYASRQLPYRILLVLVMERSSFRSVAHGGLSLY